MPFFEPRISTVKITFSPFSAQSMLEIGQVTLDHMKERIISVRDEDDKYAPPLTERYKFDKANGRRVALSGNTKYRGLPIRNWTLRGRTLGACKVKFASQDRVTIGPTSEEASRIMAGRNRKDRMWGVSPSDNEAMIKVMLVILRTNAVARVEHEKAKAA